MHELWRETPVFQVTDGSAFVTCVLSRGLSVIRILGAVLENVSYALIRVNHLQTVITSKGGETIRIMRDDIFFIRISGEKYS
jgi:hypothetical protein